MYCKQFLRFPDRCAVYFCAHTRNAFTTWYTVTVNFILRFLCLFCVRSYALFYRLILILSFLILTLILILISIILLHFI